MTDVFSPRTLGDFEDASASIPLRQLNRAFERAHVVPGDDPAGLEGTGGARRTQFRRYVAAVDQQDPQQRNRLGDALGALIEEVATSKKDYLVKSAERDGFVFIDGVFRAAAATISFAIARVADFARIDEFGRRLSVLADERPADAVAGAAELVASVCVAVRASPNAPAEIAAVGKGAALVHSSVEQLCAVVARLNELPAGDLAPGHARLAAGVAVAVACFLAETYAIRETAVTGGRPRT